MSSALDTPVPVAPDAPAARPGRRRSRRVLVLAVLLAAVAGVAAVLTVGLNRDPSVVRSVLLGTPAPALAGPTIDGRAADLRDYRGKVVLVNVWASWCLACRAEHPVLAAAQRDLGPSGLQILGIDMRDTDQDASAFLTKMGGATWPSIRDANSQHAVEWGTFAVPETYVVDRDGTILKKAVGAVTPAWIQDNVVPLLSAP